MTIYQIDEKGLLYISPVVDDWVTLDKSSIFAVFNLDSDLDQHIPSYLNRTLYIFFPFEDRDLPDLGKLHALAQFGASLINTGYPVLSHCGMGHNRSALLAGLMLNYLGFPGEEAVRLIRERRTGALYNQTFASYLEALPAQPTRLMFQRPDVLFQ
ncbi:hypothetical protein GCM10023187_03380 [Nibrella viscosa]|uniref:Tyrosine specific protein phosphatases domain-containing protein n=1 Tax=Nibrella viscosa TaxID=1084524 RepID=A0ABP8JUE7_9BACT